MLVTILGSGNQPGNLRATNTLIKGWTKANAKRACCQYKLINLMKLLKLGHWWAFYI